MPERHSLLALAALVAVVVAGCGDNAEPPPREVTLDAMVGANGLSNEIVFTVPEDTRSVTIVVEGAATALYALGALTLFDGIDRVGLGAEPIGAAMRASYDDEEIGQMPGGLLQSIRLGTYTHVYPYRPGQEVPAGQARLRVASDAAGPVRVTVLMPEEDAANVLSLHLIVISDTLTDPNTAPFVTELERIFGQAGIVVRVASVERITGSALERITQSTEPQESPASQSAMLPGLIGDDARDGLDVFIVESLPSGIGGLSLGTPGPPIRRSYYFGVLIRGGPGAVPLARVVAHEVAHFLALQHVQNIGISGAIYPDPLDDTQPGQGNLMETGTILTADQAFALTRSALLRP